MKPRSCWICAVILAGTVSPSPAAPATRQRVDAIKVVTDKAPDCSSLRSIVQSVTRGCRTNDEKAIALYNFLRLANYHLQYPSEKGGISSLKLINVYGWSLCGGLHTVEASLWRELGWKWRYVGWSRPGHTTVEAFYDGRWHYLDTFLKFYTWVPDPGAPGGRTIASQADIRARPELVTDALWKDPDRRVYYFRDNRFENINGKANWRAPALFVCGDTPEGVLTGVRHSRIAGSPTGWMGIKFDDEDYSTDVNLAAGESLELTWDAVPGGQWWSGKKYVPRHSCGDKDYRNCPCLGPILEPYRTASAARTYANGRLRVALDLRTAACLGALAGRTNVKHERGRLVPADPRHPASIVLDLSSPYIITLASGKARGADKAEVSADGGKTFAPVALEDFSKAAAGRYRVLVRLTFARELADIALTATVQCNRSALPYLSPGRNAVTVSARHPGQLGRNLLVVTYAYRTGSRGASYEEMADRGEELGRGHHASWSDELTVVQKRLRAGELPATFEIDVPTPKDRHPVYPRMVFLRREVVAPGASPLPLPPGSVPSRVGPGESLKTLPAPFLAGIEKPPKRVVRRTATRTIELAASHVASKTGGVFDNHFIKWLKDGSEAWVMLVGGRLDGLPEPRRIARARIVLPVVAATPQASTKVGVTLLRSAFEPGRPFSFKELGEVAGTTIVPKQPGGKPYAKPRRFAVDITRAVKRVAAGDAAFHGLAIRTVPDRGVDDGWTVRVDLEKNASIVLELETYADGDQEGNPGSM